MAKRKPPKKVDYEVGYGRPPKHSQFPPGVSGNKGRRKPLEGSAEMIARIRDERVEVNGKWISKFELAVTQTINQTIKSGKPRDLKLLLELLDQYGAIPEIDREVEAKAGADEVVNKLFSIFDRTYLSDPGDPDALDGYSREEVKQIMSCESCAPLLRQAWANEERQALSKR